MNNVLPSGVVPGFTPDVFCVSREAKYSSFDGTHLEKMPDLHFRVLRNEVSLPSEDGLFVECKPVDREHPAGRDYCNKGIIRFVNGDYAWALSEAMMVGYASPGYSLPDKLSDAISQRKTALKTRGNAEKCDDCAASGYCQHSHITVHERDFVYPQTNSRAPRITLRHVWLNRA